TSINGKNIHSISEIRSFIKQNDIDMAILTVPREFAQKIAETLVAQNIKYIWNFSPMVLDVPQDVQVWNENLMGNFLQFAYKMQD
ncbi:redox-sensing transcriptional repressor Rex, partial [bacterium]|nr:redox-sensing transcriptional repressor Rex [bacterium]